MKSAAKIVIAIVILGVIAFGFVQFYPYIFSKVVEGKILKVERINLNVALMQNDPQARVRPELFSFAVAIQGKDGNVHTASAEDRQWAAVTEGLCVKAKYFPYPPWNLDKSGTYYGARLLESRVCE